MEARVRVSLKRHAGHFLYVCAASHETLFFAPWMPKPHCVADGGDLPCIRWDMVNGQSALDMFVCVVTLRTG